MSKHIIDLPDDVNLLDITCRWKTVCSVLVYSIEEVRKSVESFQVNLLQDANFAKDAVNDPSLIVSLKESDETICRYFANTVFPLINQGKINESSYHTIKNGFLILLF